MQCSKISRHALLVFADWCNVLNGEPVCNNASSINFYSVSLLDQSKVWQEICSMCCLNIDVSTLPEFCWYNFKHVTFVKKIAASIVYSLAGQGSIFFSTFHLQYLSRFCFHALLCLLRNHRNGPWYTKSKTLCAGFFWIF